MFGGRGTGIPGKRFLGRVTEVFCVKLRVCMEPLFWGAVLVQLKVRNEVVKEIDEIVFEPIISDQALCPNQKAGAPLRYICHTNGNIDEPGREKHLHFIERVLEFGACLQELRLAAIQRLDNALDILFNIPVSHGLVTVELRKFVDVEGTIGDIIESRLRHPMPTRENVLRKLHGLIEQGLGGT